MFRSGHQRLSSIRKDVDVEDLTLFEGAQEYRIIIDEALVMYALSS